MRIPVPVKAAEASCGKRLIYRSVVFEPWITPSYCTRICRQLVRELWVQQRRTFGPATVMNQARNRANIQLANAVQRRIRPTPVGIIQPLRRNLLPQYRMPQSFHSEFRKPIEIGEPV